jgi:hypothetical protein
MDTISYTVAGDATRVRADVEAALTAAGLACTWTDAWTGHGTKGNLVANFFAGWMAQYMRVDVAIRTTPDGAVTVNLTPSTGSLGGLPGQRKVQRTFGAVLQFLDAALDTRGVACSRV